MMDGIEVATPSRPPLFFARRRPPLRHEGKNLAAAKNLHRSLQSTWNCSRSLTAPSRKKLLMRLNATDWTG